MTGEPLAPGAAAIILYRQVDQDDNVHTPHEDDYVRIKVLKEQGRESANVQIPFDKSFENIVSIKARTIHPDGSIVNFDGQVFDKSVVKGRGVKIQVKTFTFPAVEVGSILEYSFTRDFAEDHLYDSHWILDDDLFTKRASFSLKPYEGDDFGDFTLRWSSRLPAGAAAPAAGPDHIIRLEVSNIEAFQSEELAPPENELKSRVDFIYSDDTTKDEAQFWRNVGKKMNTSMERFINKRKEMESALKDIIAPQDDPETKLRKIYDRVQKLRNTSFEVHKTEQERRRGKEKDAATADDVWKRGYGDGTELTWLFMALARAAGFEASGVWASNRADYFFNPKLLNPRTLDTNLVIVKLNGQDIYCDPGFAFTPFGLLPWSETGVRGLKLDKDGGSWITTFLPDSSVSQVARKAHLRMSETGDLEGTLTLTFTGLEASRRRLYERNEDETERKKYLEDEAQQSIPAASQIELSNKPAWSESNSPLVAEFTLKVPGWVARAGRRALVPAGIFSNEEKHLFEHADRVHPIYLDFPSRDTDDVTIDLPLGWQISSLPASQPLDLKAFVYKLTAENDKGSIHFSRTLSVDALLISKDSYATLRSFFQRVRTSDEQQVVLQPIVN